MWTVVRSVLVFFWVSVALQLLFKTWLVRSVNTNNDFAKRCRFGKIPVRHFRIWEQKSCLRSSWQCWIRERKRFDDSDSRRLFADDCNCRENSSTWPYVSLLHYPEQPRLAGEARKRLLILRTLPLSMTYKSGSLLFLQSNGQSLKVNCSTMMCYRSSQLPDLFSQHFRAG